MTESERTLRVTTAVLPEHVKAKLLPTRVIDVNDSLHYVEVYAAIRTLLPQADSSTVLALTDQSGLS